MRLMVKVPEVKKELEAGKITLTATAKLATHVRREKTGTAETLNLLSVISGKTTREVEQHLAKNATVEYQMEKFKAITSETTRIIIDVDQEFLALMNRVRELKGHPGTTTQELLKTSMKNLIEKHSPKKTEVKGSKEQNCGTNSNKTKEGLRAPEVKNKSNSNKATTSTTNTHSRYIPYRIKNEIRLRSGDQCEYVDSNTQRRCPCKTKLEFDHVVPFSLGGQSTFENLRHYCTSHNKLSAIRQYGATHMSQFLKN
jgi:5-methylcytosine-specific restriction endonuclease McrA